METVLYHKDPFLVRFPLRSILMLLVMLMTTPHCADSNIENTISSLISSSARLFNWFQQNAMKPNLDKCLLLLSTNQNKLANTNSNAIHKSSSGKLLGITIDTNLKLYIHVNNLCKKASQKINALKRIASLMDITKGGLLWKPLSVCILIIVL